LAKFYHEPAFDFEDERVAILGQTPDQESLDQTVKPSWTVPTELAYLFHYPLLRPDQEYHLFRKYNCLKYSAFMADSDDEAGDFRCAADRVRDQLVSHNQRLIFRVARDYARRQVRFRHAADDPTARNTYYYQLSQLMADGNLCLLQCVDQFDYRLGFRFSTYLREGVHLRLTGLIGRRTAIQERFVTGLDHQFDQIESRPPADTDSASLDRVRQLIADRITDPVSRQIVSMRLGLTDGRIWTYQKIAAALGVMTWQTVQVRFRRAAQQAFDRVPKVRGSEQRPKNL
jgi:DNA-directed RNA polymerase sigma subunit (sigma70/sigma32)